MKILRFRADKLHGYLNFDLNFESNLVFLTGINGSGKTSIVRSIIALLTPSAVTLAEMEYASVSVTVSTIDGELTIQSERSEDEIILRCTTVDGDLRIPKLRKEAFESRSHFLVRQRDFYREQEAMSIQNPTLAAIDKLPTPMFLDLERRYQEGGRLRRGLDESRGRASPVNPLAGSIRDSLDVAGGLAERAYRNYLAGRSQRTDNLKQQMVLLAFRLSKEERDFDLIPSATERRDVLKKIARNEKVLPDSLSQIGISVDSIGDIVLPFFSRVREVVRELPSRKMLEGEGMTDKAIKSMQEWSAISPQVRQIDQLVELIEQYNSDVSAIFSPINSYLVSVNSFLTDSNKELSFDSSGNLQVEITPDAMPRPITALSSGERQLVVILTHLAFNQQAKRANVLIIDEPELSLHVRWQELFVDAVLGASPGIQLILATHSPGIIRGRQDSCIDVQEAQQSDSLFG